jgi:glutathione S-transferase
MPRQGRFAEALRYQRRRGALVAGRAPLTWPEMGPLDEFPLVPFLFGPNGENLYDSSAIAEWLDRETGPASWLIPDEGPALHFAVRLIDEALDEVGLYLVHHNRWVVAARDNGAGERLADEMRPLASVMSRVLARQFPVRQVRRLPYLFSVADPADRSYDDLPRRLRPPAREGFPPTHGLLERAYLELLDAVEPVVAARPFLFGDRFTLADASLYGQLGMNRTDASAWRALRSRAPATAAWIDRLAVGDFSGHRAAGRLEVDAALHPLLDWVGRTFVSLMQQNEAAYETHLAAGATRFNEAGFDGGESLYDGELLGEPFRSVAKTFQVAVWRRLRTEWSALEPAVRSRFTFEVGEVLPARESG